LTKPSQTLVILSAQSNVLFGNTRASGSQRRSPGKERALDVPPTDHETRCQRTGSHARIAQPSVALWRQACFNMACQCNGNVKLGKVDLLQPAAKVLFTCLTFAAKQDCVRAQGFMHCRMGKGVRIQIDDASPLYRPCARR
jgi:hypothetical protein